MKKVGPNNKCVFYEFLYKKLNINVKIDAVSVAHNVSAHAMGAEAEAGQLGSLVSVLQNIRCWAVVCFFGPRTQLLHSTGWVSRVQFNSNSHAQLQHTSGIQMDDVSTFKLNDHSVGHQFFFFCYLGCCILGKAALKRHPVSSGRIWYHLASAAITWEDSVKNSGACAGSLSSE
jgi:hypothetical protein